MTPELLAPAGSLDALKAAVSAGADAIYLGAASFGARAAVGFGPDELKEALRFAHFHGRRIYVTVNTLVKDGELSDLRDSLARLRDLRADAILIQDLGVLKLCREEFPELTLHASTQMSLHTPSGVRWAADHGLSRVVLNREASLEDIRAAAATGIEVEVFAHGALCVSVSGQCALSASLGERSGNRGRCGQPCRLPYQYRGIEQAWLSPADLCTLPILKQLADAGAASLKLEGRLKRPEYVYTVTEIYRRALDRLDSRESWSADPKDMDGLTQIFCRGRFTEGYAGGQQDAGILNPGHTAHEGICIGQIGQVSRKGGVYLARFTPTRTLSDQDGLSVGEDKCIYTGPEVPAGQTATLRLHRPAAPGTPVQRTESARQLAAAVAGYSDAALKRLDRPFTAELRAMPGEQAELALTSGGAFVRILGPTVMRAEKKPLDEATVRQAFSKTGGAPFALDGLTVVTEGAYLSSAQLNALRREGLAALEDAVIALNEPVRTASKASVPQPASRAVPPKGRLYVRTDRPEEIPSLLDAGADHVLLSLNDIRAAALERLDLSRLPAGRVSLALPPVADDTALEQLTALAKEAGIPLAADNAGQLGPQVLLTAEGVPVFNAQTEAFLEERGVHGAVLSPELSGKEIASMPEPGIERILCVYGRQRLMLLNHCPERVYRGLTAGKESCRLCDSGNGLQGQSLTDRKGLRLPFFPYRTDRGCIVRLYSAKPVSLLPYMDYLRRLPLSFLLSFTDESTDLRLRLVKAFKEGADFRLDATTGKYLTGVL